MQSAGKPRSNLVVWLSEGLLGYGIVGALLRLLDYVSRGETAIDIYKLLVPRAFGFIVHPLFSLALIVGGFLLLWSFAQKSEAHVPKLINPTTQQPFERPIYPALKRAKSVGVISTAIAILLWIGARYIYPLWLSPVPPPQAGYPKVPGLATAHKSPGVALSPAPKAASPKAQGKPTLNPLDKHLVTATPEVLQPSTAGVANTPPSVDDARIARSVPTNLIPQDPIQAVAAVERMRTGIREVIQNKETITFLISWPKDDNTYLVFVSSLLSSVCRDTPRQCWFTQQGDPRDLDKPPVQGSGKRGITVHGPDANALARSLGYWFETYSTSSVPSELRGYKEPTTKYLIWIDIGPGSPWKQ
jgi:hypothetical protein